MAGVIAVVACDKPPVGTLAAMLEHNAPGGDALRRLDPARDRPRDRRAASTSSPPSSSPPIPTPRSAPASRCTPAPARAAAAACSPTTRCRRSSPCSGMEPLHMVAPASDDPRRVDDVPRRARRLLVDDDRAGIRPRDIVTPASLRNAFAVVMAMGGSTNVVLHGVEIARAAGIDLWDDVLSQQEFNELSRRLPVLVNMRPFGAYSMVDVDAIGGVAVIVKELLAAGLLDGSSAHLHRRDARRAGRAPRPARARRRRRPLRARAVQGDRRAAPAAGQPRARRRRDPEGRRRRGRHRRRPVHRSRARVRERAAADRGARARRPTRSPTATSSSSATRARAARRACPRCSTRRRASPRCAGARDITIALMTDARFSGGSVGLVIGHVVARGVPRRPDRAARGRRHDRRRPQHRPPRLPRARRPDDVRARATRVGRGRRRERRHPPRRAGRHEPGAAAHPRHRDSPPCAARA